MSENLNKNQRYVQLHSSNTNDSFTTGPDKKYSKAKDQLNHSEIIQRVPEGLMSTEVGRRENARVEDFARLPRNDATSHSLLGNLSGTEQKLKKQF